MVGERIKRIRRNKGLSLTVLAERSGVSKSYLSYLERDLRTNPSLQILTKIANALGCSLEEILGEEKSISNNEMSKLDDQVVTYLKNSLENGTISGDLKDFRSYVEFLNWKATNK